MKERWEEELYPFLAGGGSGGDASEADSAPVLEDVGSSTRQKADDVTRLRERLWERHADDLVRAARLLTDALDGGGKVLAFGNGGSATDAQDLVATFNAGPVETVLPALPVFAATVGSVGARSR